MKKKNIILVGIGAALVGAAYFFLKKRKQNEEKPSKNAPQVPVENPGDQSEFPKSASESELG